MRLRHAREFAAIIRRGRRISGRHLVLHCASTPTPDGGRAGFVVSKAVGNAVTRHRVTRRLRPLVAARLPQVPMTNLVVRALPSAATAASTDLAADLDRALGRAGYSVSS